MPVIAKAYGPFLTSLFNKEIDWDSDSIKALLTTSAYVPDQDAHRYKSSVTNELVTTATTLAAAASSGATSISVAASVPVGNAIAIDTAGTVEYRIVTAVTGSGPYTLTLGAIGTGAAALGSAHASGAAVQANPGYTAGGVALTGVTVAYNASTNTLTLDANDIAWAAATLNARELVLYDSTPSTDATRPLIGYVDFGADMASQNAAFSVAWDPTGILTATVA